MTRTVKIITALGVKAPTPQSSGAAGIDLHAMIEDELRIRPQEPAVLIPTGIRIDMSEHPDMCAVILPRSGLGHKKGLVMGNGTGLIDSDYQGELFVSAWNRNPQWVAFGMGRKMNEAIVIHPGDRIAQLVFLPVLTPEVVFEEVDTFETTERGEHGFGSTGTGG